MSTTPDDHDETKGEAEEPEFIIITSPPVSNITEVNDDSPSETKNTAAAVEEEAAKELEKSPSPPPEPPKKKLCGVCNEKEYKYKCSRCYLP